MALNKQSNEKYVRYIEHRKSRALVKVAAALAQILTHYHMFSHCLFLDFEFSNSECSLTGDCYEIR